MGQGGLWLQPDPKHAAPGIDPDAAPGSKRERAKPERNHTAEEGGMKPISQQHCSQPKYTIGKIKNGTTTPQKNDTPATHRTRSLQKGFTKQREKNPSPVGCRKKRWRFQLAWGGGDGEIRQVLKREGEGRGWM